ncbi:hypothetical protein ANO11243_016200 [Dothideomycetidae sp. 11243]|nr:hypothetical protein ANO11243_016200 [fungal sp. No.11243]
MAPSAPRARGPLNPTVAKHEATDELPTANLGKRWAATMGKRGRGSGTQTEKGTVDGSTEAAAPRAIGAGADLLGNVMIDVRNTLANSCRSASDHTSDQTLLREAQLWPRVISANRSIFVTCESFPQVPRPAELRVEQWIRQRTADKQDPGRA